MKTPIYILLLCFLNIHVKAQNNNTCKDTLAPNTNGYNFLCCGNIKYFGEELRIVSDAISSKIDSFDCYKFIFPNTQKCANIMAGDSSLIDYTSFISSLNTHKLIINNKPFTGYFKIANSYKNNIAFIKEITLYEYQFKDGKIEGMNRKYDLINEKEIEEIRTLKPVFYLYPIKNEDVSVIIQSTHKLSHVYPAYNNGWQVIAKPDGTIINKATGKEHYCLFWETEGAPIVNSIDSGFVVKGNETEKFLEEKLIQLGLSNKEANEFIIFWLPQMENNPYNAIYFATKDYEKISQLTISPKPDNIIRVMMLWQALEKSIDLFPQILPNKPSRDGFTAVEWGGTKVDSFIKNP